MLLLLLSAESWQRNVDFEPDLGVDGDVDYSLVLTATRCLTRQ